MRVDFSNVSSGFDPIPEGQYLATVFNIEQKTGKDSGAPYLNWQFKIQGGEFDGRRAFFMTSMQPQSLWNLKDTLVALNYLEKDFKGEIDLDTSELLGRECLITITHEQYQGETRDRVTKVSSTGAGGGAGGAGAGSAPLYR